MTNVICGRNGPLAQLFGAHDLRWIVSLMDTCQRGSCRTSTNVNGVLSAGEIVSVNVVSR